MLTEDALARPRESIALQRRHLADGTMERLWSPDNAFHSLLFQIARKEQTYQMMTGFTAHFDRVRNMSLVTVKNSKIVDDHALIVDALAARDKAAGAISAAIRWTKRRCASTIPRSISSRQRACRRTIR